MRRCRGVGMWEVSGMWDVGSDVCTGEASIGHCRRPHFGKGAADINLVGLPLDPSHRKLSYA